MHAGASTSAQFCAHPIPEVVDDDVEEAVDDALLLELLEAGPAPPSPPKPPLISVAQPPAESAKKPTRTRELRE